MFGRLVDVFRRSGRIDGRNSARGSQPFRFRIGRMPCPSPGTIGIKALDHDVAVAEKICVKTWKNLEIVNDGLGGSAFGVGLDFQDACRRGGMALGKSRRMEGIALDRLLRPVE